MDTKEKLRDIETIVGDRFKRVWVEDDATRGLGRGTGHEDIKAAYLRLFSREYNRGNSEKEYDLGDVIVYLMDDGNLVINAFDGYSIYIPKEG